jgi:hypothetical protein
MPDGSRPPSSPPALSLDHRGHIERTRETMIDAHHARAAVAWLQHIAPDKVPGAGPDAAGLVAHFILFGRQPVYWTRLCLLFNRRGLSGRF